MPCFSSRSMVTDPIRIAIPNVIQPIADRKSPRKSATASGSWGGDAGAACSGEDIGVTHCRAGWTGVQTAGSDVIVTHALQGLGMPTVSGETFALALSNNNQALACTAGNAAFCAAAPDDGANSAPREVAYFFTGSLL